MGENEILRKLEEYLNELRSLNSQSTDYKVIANREYKKIMEYLVNTKLLKKLLFPVYKDIYDEKGNLIRNEIDIENSPKNNIYNDLMIKKANYDALNRSGDDIVEDLKVALKDIIELLESHPQEQFQSVKAPVSDLDIAKNRYLLEEQAARKEFILKKLGEMSPSETVAVNYDAQASNDYETVKTFIDDIKKSIPKIQECLDELEDYKSLSIEQQQHNVDFRILIFTKIKENLIYASPTVKQFYEQKANYFESLANNNKFTALIKKMNSIKDGLLDLVDFSLVDNWIKKTQDEYFQHLEEIVTKTLKLDGFAESVTTAVKLINELKNSKTKDIFDAYPILCFI